MRKLLIFCRKRFYFKYALSILWTLIILYLSLGKMPDSAPNRIKIPHLDKVVHFMMYFIYTFFILIEFGKNKIKKTVFITIYSILFGICMEYFQYKFFPYRSADVYDGIFNSLGAISAAFLHPKIIKIINL